MGVQKEENGNYRVRLVVLGYNQIPGVDRQNNCIPLVNEKMFRTMTV